MCRLTMGWQSTWSTFWSKSVIFLPGMQWSLLLYLVKNYLKRWWQAEFSGATDSRGSKMKTSLPVSASGVFGEVRSLQVCSCCPFMTSSVNLTHGCLLRKYFPDLTCLQHWHLKLKPLPSWLEQRVLTDYILTLWGWESGNGSLTIFKQIKMHFDL